MKYTGMLILLLAVTFGYTQAPDTLWTRTFGEVDDDDSGNCVLQLSDGSYIVTGSVNDSICLMKTDADGNCIWLKKYEPWPPFGGIGNYVQQTLDGGYIIAGYFHSGPYPSTGVLIKTDMNGDIIWTYAQAGGALWCVKETVDSCYVAVGGAYTGGLTKVDQQGNLVWVKVYGEYPEYMSRFNSVQQLNDGSYAVVGATSMYGSGAMDVWFVRSDANGDSLWTRTYGGSGGDYAYSFQPTSGNGYVIAGGTNSFGAGNTDLYLIKINGSGDTLWTRTLGGQYSEEGYSIEVANDSGYVITGRTGSYGAGGYDLWLLKIKPNGDTLWTMTLGGAEDDCGRYVYRTSDGGYIIAGTTCSFGSGEEDVWLIKTYPDVGIHEHDTPIATTGFTTSTVFRGSLQMPAARKCAVFDITGRRVDPESMKPGVYFIQIEGVMRQKVVKIR